MGIVPAVMNAQCLSLRLKNSRDQTTVKMILNPHKLEYYTKISDNRIIVLSDNQVKFYFPPDRKWNRLQLIITI